MIDIKTVTKEYIPNASHDVFEDGSFAVYDVVKLAVIEPETRKHQILAIYLPQEEVKDSIWKQKGKIVTFSVDGNLLESGATLYLGALENIKMQ